MARFLITVVLRKKGGGKNVGVNAGIGTGAGSGGVAWKQALQFD